MRLRGSALESTLVEHGKTKHSIRPHVNIIKVGERMGKGLGGDHEGLAAAALDECHAALSSVLVFLRPDRTWGGRKSLLLLLPPPLLLLLLLLATGLTKSLPAAAARMEAGGGTDL